MATVQYESKDNAGRKFWTGRYGRYAIRIDASRPGVYRWLIILGAAQSARASPPAVLTRPPRERRPRPAAPSDVVAVMLGDCDLIRGQWKEAWRAPVLRSL